MKYGKIFAGIVVLIAGIMAISAFASALNLEMKEGMVSTNVARYTAVAYGNGTYVEVWYNATGAYMNATAIDATTGAILKNVTLTTDVYTYNGAPSIRPAIVYDPADNVFVVAWVNSSKYLEAMAIDSNLHVFVSEFNVNGTAGVSYKGISLAYGNGYFFVVWCDSNYQLEGRFGAETYLSNVFRITNYTSYGQQNPCVAYDPVSKRFMVTWVNVTENSTGGKFYNLTGKIMGITNGTITNYTGDIMMGDSLSTGISYTAPAVVGGAGYFMVTYHNYVGSHTIYANFYDYSGKLVKNITVGHTHYRSTPSSAPAVFNGSAFVMAWSNSTDAIVSQAFCPNGTVATPMKVIYNDNSTSGDDPEVTYNSDNGTYMFSWTEYGRLSVYGLSYAVLTSGEYVPEFNWTLPLLLTIMVGSVVLVRRKH